MAKADDTDDRYIQLLDYEGIGHRAPRDKLIELGHDICDDLSNGKSVLHAVQPGLITRSAPPTGLLIRTV